MAQANVILNFPDAAIPAIKAYLLTNFAVQVDLDDNGVVTNAEALAWFGGKAQDVATTFKERAVEWAKVNDVSLLPQAYQDAKAAYDAAAAALQVQADALK